MIVGAVLCPAAPLLIRGVADGAAARCAELVAAALAAAGELRQRADRVLLVTATPHSSLTVTVPPDLGPPPFGRGPSRIGGWPNAGWVARELVGDVPLSAVGIAADDLPLADVRTTGRTGVLVLADGAICHGPAAPAAQDERAAGFERSLHRALADPDLQALASWSADNGNLGAELSATAPQALTVLAQLASAKTWLATADYFGAPFGVGYHVATWWS
ncbi:MAG: hypothetical protein ACR2P2_16195 [Nakamurella sp.]